MSFLKNLNFMHYEFLRNLFNFNSDNTGNTISSLVDGILQNDLLAPESKSKSFHCLMFNFKKHIYHSFKYLHFKFTISRDSVNFKTA